MIGRPRDVTRLEGFSDTVFGFALTLLVVSLEVPTTAGALFDQMRGFWAFGLMFAMVCWIWYEHHVFFRLSGLQDAWVVFLNSVLLFVVLFYVYPLKYLTAALLREFFGLGAAGGPQIGTRSDAAVLLGLYSAGVVAIFLVFTLLYRHAWARRADLSLSADAEVRVRFRRRGHALSLSVGLLSLALVAINRDWTLAIAGPVYFLMGPLHGWNGYRTGKALEALQQPVPEPPGDA